jgi:hypothetical protein
MMTWVLSLSDAQLVALVVLALTALSVVLRQLELVLRSRGWLRLSAGLAALRGLIVDAPSVAARLVAMLRAREAAQAVPEVLEPPRPPRQPPPGIGGIFLALALTLTGCAGPLDGAKRAANAARDLAPTLAVVLDEACTAEYQRAPSAARVVELDRVCLPLRASYRALRAAHLAAVAAILSAEAGKVDVLKAIEAGAAVLAAIEAAQLAAKAVQ